MSRFGTKDHVAQLLDEEKETDNISEKINLLNRALVSAENIKEDYARENYLILIKGKLRDLKE